MPKSTTTTKTHTSTQLNFSKYKNMYPNSDQPLFPNSSILAAILNYFSKQNIQIIISGTDIFNQEHRSSKTDNKTENKGLKKNQQKTVNEYYDDWVKMRLLEVGPQQEVGDDYQQENREDCQNNCQKQIGKVSDFIGYLIDYFGQKIEIQWDQSDANKDQEEKDESQEDHLSGNRKSSSNTDNQFSQRNLKSVRDTIADQTNKNIDEDKIEFNDQEKKFLLNYYKHFCELKASLPKGKTFDDIRELHETMNLPQWMMFCKKAGVIIKNTDISHNTRHVRLQNQLTIKQLKLIFQNNQNNAKKMGFESFCGGVADVIKLISHNNNSGGFPSIPIDPKQFLGLDNESNHFDVMDVMGIRYIREKVYFYNLSNTIERKDQTLKKGASQHNRSTLISSVNKSLSKQSELKRKRKQATDKQNGIDRDSLQKRARLAMSLTKVDKETQRMTKSDKEKSVVGAKKQIKYYRSRQERKQSELLKKLKISNLKDVKPSSDVLCNLQKLGSGDQDDYFLREYNRKQKEISEGVVSRLKKNVKKMQRKIR